MAKTQHYTTKKIAELRGRTVRRIRAMLQQDLNPKRRKTHFPGAFKDARGDWKIPVKTEADIKS